MSKPTQGPVRADGLSVIGADNQVVAVCRQAKPRNTMEARANAAKLARCWNEHHALFAALERVELLADDLIATEKITNAGSMRAAVASMFRDIARGALALPRAVQKLGGQL